MSEQWNTMSLKYLLEDQRDLNAMMGNPMGQGGAQDLVIKENVLALIVEATEVLNEVNWKPWKSALHQRKVVNRDKLLEEVIDILQFWANIVNAAEFTEEDIRIAYAAKLAVCYDRIASKNAGSI